METERWHRNSWWLCKDWKTAWRNKSLDGQFLFLQKKKSIPNFQRCFVSGLLFSFHNSQCGPRPLNVIMQRGRTGTISPLKPLYWHTCKTKINCSLLPTPLMPASARNFFWFFSFLLSAHYEKVTLFSHFAGSWNSPNEGSRAEMHLSHPSAKIPATYGAVMTLSFMWRGEQASGLGSFVTLRLLD